MAWLAFRKNFDASCLRSGWLCSLDASPAIFRSSSKSATPFPVTQRVTVQIVTTAGNGANNKNVNIRLQHSTVDTNANYVNIPECAITTIPELNALYAVTTVNHALPPSTLRFIRAICVTESSGGNASNGTATLKVLF